MPQTPDSSTSYAHSEGLLAPYCQWDLIAAGILNGTAYRHIRAAHTSPARLSCAFQTHAIVDALRRDSGVLLAKLRVDDAMTNIDSNAMRVVSDLGGFEWVLGAALLAGNAVGLFWCDLTKPETLKRQRAWYD